jgi:exodeoxyribonuclease-3
MVRAPKKFMLVATWNVNSLNIRKERLLAWLADRRPDVVCLQELKGVDESFPLDEVRQAGYHAAVFGQRTYNGVAILSREEPAEVERGFGDGVEDAQARLIAATLAGVRILSAYIPNGGEVGSEKYEYKKEWLGRLKSYLERRGLLSRPMLLCGDFNIAPERQDASRPDEWEGTVLFNNEMRATFQDLLRMGLVDTFRLHQPEGNFNSWWDYRQLAFPKNNGLRIDHILASGAMAQRCTASRIDREARKGKKPSDHAPVFAEFSDS